MLTNISLDFAGRKTLKSLFWSKPHCLRHVYVLVCFGNCLWCRRRLWPPLMPAMLKSSREGWCLCIIWARLHTYGCTNPLLGHTVSTTFMRHGSARLRLFTKSESSKLREKRKLSPRVGRRDPYLDQIFGTLCLMDWWHWLFDIVEETATTTHADPHWRQKSITHWKSCS